MKLPEWFEKVEKALKVSIQEWTDSCSPGQAISPEVAIFKKEVWEFIIALTLQMKTEVILERAKRNV